jgi:hypothetical protein
MATWMMMMMMIHVCWIESFQLQKGEQETGQEQTTERFCLHLKLSPIAVITGCRSDSSQAKEQSDTNRCRERERANRRRSEEVEDLANGGVAERASAAAGTEFAGAGAAEGMAAGDEGRALAPRHAHAATLSHAAALLLLSRVHELLPLPAGAGRPLLLRPLQQSHQRHPLHLRARRTAGAHCRGDGPGRSTVFVGAADDVEERAAPPGRGDPAAFVVVAELEEISEVGRRGELLGQRHAAP